MTKKYPKVSIIITNYNYSEFLSRCIRSCLSQEGVATETIIVDDCSTDNSNKVLDDFSKDARIVKNKKNIGVAESSNKGVRLARGQFTIRVDADDFIKNDTCFFLSRYLEDNHDAFCVSCDYHLVDKYENVIIRKSAEEFPISCGIMYRRDLFLELGGYNPKMRHREEEELRKRLGEDYTIDHLKIPLYRYRMHDTNKTKTKEYLETKI